METLKVTSMKYTQTRRGIAYECNTNIKGLKIYNDGHGGGTFMEPYNLVRDNNIPDYTECELEDLITEYEQQQ